MNEWIAGNASYDLKAEPASFYGETSPVVFLTLAEDKDAISSNSYEEELSLDAAKALIRQLQDAVDDMENRPGWESFKGQGGTLKVHDLIALEDDPEFSLYVEQDEHTAFSLPFSEAERLVEYLTQGMEKCRRSMAERDGGTCD